MRCFTQCRACANLRFASYYPSMGLRRTNMNQIPRRTIDLQECVQLLQDVFEVDALSVYLFGSRRDETGSIRSDVDLLIELSRRPTQEEMGEIWDTEPYLDVFAADRGVASSLVNESQIRAATNEDLVSSLRAFCLMRDGDWQSDADHFRYQTVLADRNPAASLPNLYELEDAVPAERADLLVVTALTEEFDAVCTAIGGIPTIESSAQLTLVDNGGSPWKIRVVNLHEMGSVGAALKTSDALRRSKASHVVLIGICAGVPDKADILDVIVPQYISYYEPGKVTEDGTAGAAVSCECSETVCSGMSYLDTVLKDVKIHADGVVMVCGEKVIAHGPTRDEQAGNHRKTTAIDMESYGVLRAAASRKTPATVIKSVCDLADGAKNDKFHAQAAGAAARVFAEGVRRGVFRP